MAVSTRRQVPGRVRKPSYSSRRRLPTPSRSAQHDRRVSEPSSSIRHGPSRMPTQPGRTSGRVSKPSSPIRHRSSRVPTQLDRTNRRVSKHRPTQQHRPPLPPPRPERPALRVSEPSGARTSRVILTSSESGRVATLFQPGLRGPQPWIPPVLLRRLERTHDQRGPLTSQQRRNWKTRVFLSDGTFIRIRPGHLFD